MEAILQVDGVTKQFGGTVANDDVTLTISEGECHGIVGPNGSGKTTLFDVVTGFSDPDSGRVRFRGEDITGLTPDTIARRGLVRTFQLTAPFEALTVRENLYAAYASGLLSTVRVSDSRRERASELLTVLELERVADERAGTLSGGQQKLLELGRAMMLDPDCVLLDEPTAGVNPVTQERLLAYIRRVTDAGTTVVLIEHDMDVVAALTDRVTVLDRGRVLLQGSFDTVIDDERMRTAYHGRELANLPEGAGDTRQSVDVAGDTRQSEEAAGEYLVGENIVTGYGTHRVVDGVSVRTHDGITCIFGPNGSGKSTLLKALAGVQPVWSGTVRYENRELTGRDTHEFIASGISMVPQRDMVFDGLSVRENLQLGGTLVDDRVAKARMETVLDAFEPLADRLDATAGDLSGGQRTMLGFGRAMMTDADVYLLDEPTASLAPSMTADVLDMVGQLVRDGSQVVLVEQRVRETLDIADHVYLLARGQLQFDGSPEELHEEGALLERYLGLHGQDAVE